METLSGQQETQQMKFPSHLSNLGDFGSYARAFRQFTFIYIYIYELRYESTAHYIKVDEMAEAM